MTDNTVLIVDDDLTNLEILDKILQKNNYSTELAEDGENAWELLVNNPAKYSVVLLDRMMPKMDGMEVLDRMKNHPELKYLPVIMQTAASAIEQISEGIAHGVYYYLTKPFERQVLLSLVAAAVKDYSQVFDLQDNLQSHKISMKNLNRAEYTYQRIEEGKNIINLLSHAGDEPLQIAFGLTELIVNAVEHGNLGISYQEKGELIAQDAWEEEIKKRYQLPQYKNKYATLEFEREAAGPDGKPCVKISIKDQGHGFAWQEYIEFSIDRMSDTHGRGILMAQNSFIRMEYLDNGSLVNVWFRAGPGT